MQKKNRATIIMLNLREQLFFLKGCGSKNVTVRQTNQKFILNLYFTFKSFQIFCQKSKIAMFASSLLHMVKYHITLVHSY